MALTLTASAWAQSSSSGFHQTVLIAGSDNTAFNLRFTELLSAQLGNNVSVQGYSEEVSKGNPETLVITLGNTALARVQQQLPRPPTLALMLDERQAEPYLDRPGPAFTAIYYEAPLLRQALLGKVILPHSNKVAVLVRPGEETSYDDLASQLANYDIELRMFTVKDEDSLIATLARALSYGDFLLAIPDAAIFNSRTIKHILLTAYRRNRIVIGPSRAFVRAGVLASTYTPLEVVAANANTYVKRYLETGQLPPPEHPETYDVEVNRQVARSLNIPVPSTDAIIDHLNRLSGAAGEEASP